MKKIIFIFTLFCLGFFYFTHNTKAVSLNEILINEIAWMGTVNSSSDEWIELRNTTNNEIDLTGWTLAAQDGSPSINLTGSVLANGYFLLERTDDNSAPGAIADLIYSGALSNNGEFLELRNGDNNIINSLDASSGWPAGDNTTKQTMEKTNGGVWQASKNPGGTPKAINSELILEESVCGDGNLGGGEECDDGNNLDNDGCSANCIAEQDIIPAPLPPEEEISQKQYALGDVIINEFVSDPADGEVEWIELFNSTNQEINLDGWSIEEGSGAKTILEGVIGANGLNKFFIIEKPKGNLNNKGDIIILRDSMDNLINQISYGNWDSGDIENNAPITNDPYSLARKLDGYNTFNDANDFIITATPTKGGSNIITAIATVEETEEISEAEKAIYDYNNDIIISEIFPNPAGSDTEDEFIELFNKGEKEVNLLGWRLGDESKKRYEFKNNIKIKPLEYLAVYRSESKIALNNNGDSVKLYQPLKDDPLQLVTYKKAVEDWSFNYTKYVNEGQTMQNNKWAWSEIVTPGLINKIKTINHPPVVDFYYKEETLVGRPVMFDSSDTIDEDGDKLKYNWDFGDGFTNILPNPEHTFFKNGSYAVKLIVDDGVNKETKEKIIKIGDGQEKDKVEILGESNFNDIITPEDSIIINEFLPNPEGRDEEGEFIELYNRGNADVNLINWQVDDSPGGSSPYTFNFDLWLGGGMYYLLDRAESGLALNNTRDAARLFNNLDELIEEIEYESTVEGEAYARGRNDKWFWTTVLTPGKENIISIANSKIIVNSVDFDANNGSKAYVETTLEKIHNYESGDLVKTSGTVAVKPGILGLQYFYIVGSAGVQVYNYNKEFPNLQVGDYIEIRGELSLAAGELRIKTKTIDDFKIVRHDEPPLAEETSLENINEESVGRLVSITGEVVEKKSSIVYLDDGTDEIRLYLKKTTGINHGDIKEGDIIQATGIVSITRSGLRVMPRSPDDIIKKDAESQSQNNEILGEVATSDEWELAQRDKKLELFKYLLILAGGVIIILAVLLIKL